MHTHIETHTHTPCMVARGWLPMRAWFIPVLTPIIVILKRGKTANSHTQKFKPWRETAGRLT